MRSFSRDSAALSVSTSSKLLVCTSETGALPLVECGGKLLPDVLRELNGGRFAAKFDSYGFSRPG
jgi:hypothetical protein